MKTISKKILILMTIIGSVFLAGCSKTTVEYKYPDAMTYCEGKSDKSDWDGTRNAKQWEIFKECIDLYNSLLTGK